MNKSQNVSKFLMGMGCSYCYFEKFFQAALNFPSGNLEFDPAFSFSLSHLCFLSYSFILKILLVYSLKDNWCFKNL